MSMWFFDEAEEMEEYRLFRQEVRGVEKEYLEIRVLLRDSEAALRGDPENEHLKARVKYLRWRLEDLERQFPWISSPIAKEIALWAPPHG
jgi:hypothetical protein